jgi:hypothetical protein
MLLLPNESVCSVKSLLSPPLAGVQTGEREVIGNLRYYVEAIISNYQIKSTAPVITIFIRAAGISTFHPRAMS